MNATTTTTTTTAAGTTASRLLPLYRDLGYPEVPPVPEGLDRPFWSVMIPTYNCAELLRQTLRSVLSQDPGADRMQIEVIDDASTRDDPEAVVRELGGDRVGFHRQPQNRGAIGNFNTCLARARGHHVQILHGDDLVLPGFYDRIGAGLGAHPEAGSAHSRVVVIDEDGYWVHLLGHEVKSAGLGPDALELFARRNDSQFAAAVLRRSVVEEIGGFHPELIHTADWDMWKRAAAQAPVVFEPEVLACYRVFEGNDSARLIRTGANTADLRRAIDLSVRYLPADRCGPWLDHARRFYSWAALDWAVKLYNRADRPACDAQLREAVLLWPPIRHSRRFLKFRMRLLSDRLRRSRS